MLARAREAKTRKMASLSLVFFAGLMFSIGCAQEGHPETASMEPNSLSSAPAPTFNNTSSTVTASVTTQPITNPTENTSAPPTSPLPPSNATNISTTPTKATTTLTSISTQSSHTTKYTANTTLNHITEWTTLESKTTQTESPSTSMETSTNRTENVTTTMPTATPTSVGLNASTSSLYSTTAKVSSTTTSITSSAKPKPSTSAILVKTPPLVTKKPLSATVQHKTSKVPNIANPAKALSSVSVAAIVIGFIALVIFLLGGAYYFKIKHPSYGRLLDDTEYGSVGNFFNPMFDG